MCFLNLEGTDSEATTKKKNQIKNKNFIEISILMRNERIGEVRNNFSDFNEMFAEVRSKNITHFNKMLSQEKQKTKMN